MAINSERNMRADLELGVREGTYINLQPMWGGRAQVPVDRLTWPTYAQAERHQDASDAVLHNPDLLMEPGPGSANQQYNVPADNPALGR